mgnify:CR=1 FL=1
MAKNWQAEVWGKPAQDKPLDWRKRMSDNIAYALLAYTALQIFVTMGALHSKGGSLLPYFALALLVAAIIPACRRFEHRWTRLNDDQAADPSFAASFLGWRARLDLAAMCRDGWNWQQKNPDGYRG